MCSCSSDRPLLATPFVRGPRQRNGAGGEWASAFEDGSDLYGERELFRTLGRQRSVAPGVWGSSCKGENGEPNHGPQQLRWVGRLTGLAWRRSRHRAEGPVSAGVCACLVPAVGIEPFRRDHWSARGNGFSLLKVLSGGFSGERASESG